MIPRSRYQLPSYVFLRLFLLMALFAAAGCSLHAQGDDPERSIVLATTTSTEDSGLLDSLLPTFERATGIRVKVIAVGTGQAMKLGEDGNADVLLVHSRAAEDQFVASGYGMNAHDVMYNQFVIVGPEEDPAGVKETSTVSDAFRVIANAEAAFISRGDDSGTHKKELSLWAEAGLKPEGAWYVSAGQGMGATLRLADEKRAYTLTDEATYLAGHGGLAVLREGDASLLNPYGVIQVKSSRKAVEAERFIQFLVGEEAQAIIGAFGENEFGKPLFVPDAGKRQ